MLKVFRRGTLFWRAWVTISTILVVAFAASVIAWRPRGVKVLGAILIVILAGMAWGWFNLKKEGESEHEAR